MGKLIQLAKIIPPGSREKPDAETILNTPLMQPFFQLTSIILLKLLGWKNRREHKRIRTLYCYSRTTHINWDFFYTLLITFAFRKKMYWMGKDNLFRKPFGSVVRWMGGIPVNRVRASNLVEKTIQCFSDNKELSIVIST
jgi:1-acyl-sn-glycerol-3-phosphate acyltransferase